jgi:hypothetical protein
LTDFYAALRCIFSGVSKISEKYNRRGEKDGKKRQRTAEYHRGGGKSMLG